MDDVMVFAIGELIILLMAVIIMRMKKQGQRPLIKEY